MHIVLETPRLILGQFTENDAHFIFELNSDPEIVKYLHESVLRNEEQALKIIVDIILPQYKNNLGRWATYTKDTNEFIGWCGLKFRPERNEIDLGYRLRRFVWGMGYATEAAKHTLAYGFNNLHLNKIIARAHVENFASLKVLEKIGMQFSTEETVDGCPVKTYIAPRQHP